MDYIGSKDKLNAWIFSIIRNAYPDPSSETFLDGCAGSGAVSKYAASFGFRKVIANDLFHFSSVIVDGAISTPQSKIKECHKLINVLNALPGIDGFFYNNYSEQSGRLYFSNDNARRIDDMREYIETISDTDVKSYLLYCMLEAMSKVSNTAGVQAAFLKKLKERAVKPIVLKPECSLSAKNVFSYSNDILWLLKNGTYRTKHHENILYIDPPYNNRQYGANYHLYETLVRWDNPKLSGMTGIRDWKTESKSAFCSKSTVLSFTGDVLKATRAQRIYISYNTDGIVPMDEFQAYIQNLGFHVIIHKKEYRRFKSDASTDRTYNETPLFELVFEISR